MLKQWKMQRGNNTNVLKNPRDERCKMIICVELVQFSIAINEDFIRPVFISDIILLLIFMIFLKVM